ncbi:TPA: hypothetical protein I9Z65_003412 [Clostridium perfringens]|nr:hypothetical protein [Clostridium perfringens]HBC2031735.1 hypothetical protein [Clostridium perfringens]HBC2035114.1 hypothetical protein [Clostridium perfringens]HBC2058258.1 hypothetical protein [Clostridium perfringens]HBC2072468.1 hypothetical protein [Clostridium perfringens]
MNKYIGIIGILLGVLLNIYMFLFDGVNIIAIYLIGLLGLIISILTLVKYKEKILSCIGIILNIIPIGYLTILFIGIG